MPVLWDAVEANLITIDLIYAEVCGPADVVALDPDRRRIGSDLVSSAPVAEDEWFAVD